MKTSTKQDSKTLTDLFLGELADMYDAERRIAKALPKMVEAATSADLKKAFKHFRKKQNIYFSIKVLLSHKKGIFV